MTIDGIINKLVYWGPKALKLETLSYYQGQIWEYPLPILAGMGCMGIATKNWIKTIKVYIEIKMNVLRTWSIPPEIVQFVNVNLTFSWKVNSFQLKELVFNQRKLTSWRREIILIFYLRWIISININCRWKLLLYCNWLSKLHNDISQIVWLHFSRSGILVNDSLKIIFKAGKKHLFFVIKKDEQDINLSK